ncbi:hypothetical protein U14_05233 [Candidatus Moduliflexus flocculans]|uniref:Uncharacterized protein n=1 Tax=Candidatus Moduliflexus flocculans TaxID=1499966 RepID=A0A081BRC5_9BACT|nr:hypothetical protein U14_05233 [Candidatus Moduliflexus flocculans]
MQAVRITQIVMQEGIRIPVATVQRFQGKRVDIIILPNVESEPPSLNSSRHFTSALADLFEQYQDIRAYQGIDPVQWEREVRNEW